MKTKESRCIICGNKREGLEVLPDYILNTIRWVKHLTRSERNYRLVVCRDCFERYRKLRERYQRRQAECLVLGLLFAVVITAFNPMPGILFGIAVMLFLYLLAQLSWMPPLRMPETKKKAP